MKVAGNLTFTTITAGTSHACALEASGQAWCWGHNYYGQLGNRAVGGDWFAPVAVRMPVDYLADATVAFQSISAGGSHTCAVDSAGGAWCWGADLFGQLGDGGPNNGNKSQAVAVAGGSFR